MVTLGRGARIAVSAAAIAAFAMTAQLAHASEGSVPAEVQEFASDPDGLVAQLDDVFGVDSKGQGITFDDTTEVGQLNRVFAWTDDYLDGAPTEVAVERLNEWVAPIAIGDEQVGLATIWINPATVQPELADFVQGASIAETFSEIPTDAYLVRDVEREAWFTLVGSTLSPLVSGQSGISGPTTIGVYQGLILRQAENVSVVENQPPSGILTSILIVVGTLAATVLALGLFHRRERTPKERHESSASLQPTAESRTLDEAKDRRS